MLFERKKKSVVFSCIQHFVFLCVSIWDRDGDFFFNLVCALPAFLGEIHEFFLDIIIILFYLRCHV